MIQPRQYYSFCWIWHFPSLAAEPDGWDQMDNNGQRIFQGEWESKKEDLVYFYSDPNWPMHSLSIFGLESALL